MSTRERVILALLGVLAACAVVFGLLTDRTTGPAVAPVVDPGQRAAVAPARESGSTMPRLALEKPPPARSSIAVRVVSPQGEGLGGAWVCVLGARRRFHREATRETGRVLVPYPSVRRVLLTASCGGFGYAQRWLDAPYPDQVEIRLGLSASISGSVHLADGRLPASAVRVFAWPEGSDPPGAAFGVRPTLPSADVDTRGGFTITGLDANVRYTLGAGARGWTTHGLARRVSCGTAEVDLTLWRVFACVVHVRDQNGNQLPDARLFARTEYAFSPVASSESIYPGDVDIELAQLGELAATRGRSDWRDWLLAYKVADPNAQVGPVDVLYEIPGFVRAKGSVPLFAVGGSVFARTIFLSRTAAGFGVLRIRLVSDDAWSRELALGGPPTATVKLTPRFGNARELEIPYHGLIPEERDVEGVPFGEYRVDFVAARGTYRDPAPGEPARVVRIGPTPAEVALDVRPLCSALLEVPDRGLGASQARSPLVVEVRRRGAPRAVEFMFSRPPYLMQGLPPGRYRLALRDRPLPGEVHAALDVELQSEGVQHIVWPTTRRRDGKR